MMSHARRRLSRALDGGSAARREEPIVVVLHFQLVGIAAGLVFSFFNWRTPLPWEWFCLLMCGVLTQVGQVCLTP